jgi:phosphogluconate dehydratase
MINFALTQVESSIMARSKTTRAAYLSSLPDLTQPGTKPARSGISCGNLAHQAAGMSGRPKIMIAQELAPTLGIISAYNDMLSAHQPYERYPQLIREHAATLGAVAQMAGGVPAMCDGITQGREGMELSLFSRDVIAQATAVALSHNVFDSAVLLGICDKIVPGLIMGAAQFGHLPMVLIPSGPMASGISNDEKAAVRKLYAKGEVGREGLKESEMRAYHSPGTCTFYGTANSNQLLVEVMGLHLPGAAFVLPGTGLRDALTRAAVAQALAGIAQATAYNPLYKILDVRTFINAIVALLATGGSTNHTLHIPAMARACGLIINWDDFDALSAVVPLLARVYPNGAEDINAFHAAGGTPFLIRELLDAGLLFEDVPTVVGQGLRAYTRMPTLNASGTLEFQPAAAQTGNAQVLRGVLDAFDAQGGLRLLRGNLGRAVTKVSAVAQEQQRISASARVFDDQDEVLAAYKRGELSADVVIVLRNQGPRACGMPELHKLMPTLAVMQDAGRKVALVTDGRLSGASGKVLAALHVTPEAACGGLLAQVRDGDIVTVDGVNGELSFATTTIVTESTDTLSTTNINLTNSLGRQLFGLFRAHVSGAEQGACPLFE